MGYFPLATQVFILLLSPWLVIMLSQLSEAKDLNIPDVTTYNGHLFSMSFRSHPVLGSGKVDIKISLLDSPSERQIGGIDQIKEDQLTPLPPWLHYNDTSKTLEGIPDSKDNGQILLFVSARCNDESDCHEKEQSVFQMNIVDRSWKGPSDLLFRRNPVSRWEQTDTDPTPEAVGYVSEFSECSEDKVVASLILCASLDDLPTAARIQIVRDLAHFLSIPDHVINIELSSTQNLKAAEFGFQIVSAGPGLGDDCTLNQNIELLWQLPCQVVQHLTDFVKVLQHNVDVGRFQEETGFGVVGWYVASSNSLVTRRNRRRRYVSKVKSTPIPTPTLEPASPSLPSSEIYRFSSVSEYSSSTVSGHTVSKEHVSSSPVSQEHVSSFPVSQEHVSSSSKMDLSLSSSIDSSSKKSIDSLSLSSSLIATKSLTPPNVESTPLSSSILSTDSSARETASAKMSLESYPSDFVSVANLITAVASEIHPSASVPFASHSLSPSDKIMSTFAEPLTAPEVSTDHKVTSTLSESVSPLDVFSNPAVEKSEENVIKSVMEQHSVQSSLFDRPPSAIDYHSLHGISAINSVFDTKTDLLLSSTSLETDAIYSSSDMPFKLDSSSQPTPSFTFSTSSSYVKDFSIAAESRGLDSSEKYSLEQSIPKQASDTYSLERQLSYSVNPDLSEISVASQPPESNLLSQSVSVTRDSVTDSESESQIVPSVPSKSEALLPSETELSEIDILSASPPPPSSSESSLPLSESLSKAADDKTIPIHATASSIFEAHESAIVKSSPYPGISTISTDDNTTDTTSATSAVTPSDPAMTTESVEDETIVSPTTQITTMAVLDTTESPPLEPHDCGRNYELCGTQAPPNSPPIVENPIGLIIGEQGRALELTISRDVFFDIEDGVSGSLQLDLELPSGKKVPDNFWLYLVTKPPKNALDTPTQMLKGLPLHQDMDIKNLSIVLVATDSGGLQARDSIILQINDSPRTQFTHRFTLKFAIDFQKFIHKRQNIVDLMGRIASHFNDSSARFITVLEVRKGSFILSWTNNTLSGSMCQRQAVKQLLNRMVRKDGTVRSSFNRKIGRHLELLEIRFEPLGSCIIPTTTTSSTTTVLASSRAGPGLSIWAHVILPVLIALVVFIFILFLIFICNRRRKRQEALSIIEKDAFSNDRNPIIFPNEMDSDDPALQPKTPLVLPADSQLSNDSPQHQPQSQRQQQQQQQQQHHSKNHHRSHHRDQERDRSKHRSSSSSKGRNDNHHQGRKSKDKNKTKSKEDRVRVSISSTLSSDRPNNHYMEDEDNETSSRSSTMRSNKSGGGSGGQSPTKRQPPPYWQAQKHHPPPYRLPPPYMNEDNGQPAAAKPANPDAPVAKTCTTTRV